MVRFLNIVAIASLIGSAIYAYSVKYDTILRAEKIVKLRHQIERERDEIGILRAEWAHLTRPERIEALSNRFLDLEPSSLAQIVRADALPDKGPRVDQIGNKLAALGLGELANTSGDAAGWDWAATAMRAR